MSRTGYEPHFTLKHVDDDIWLIDGPHISFYGLPFPTRMTLVRLASGALWVHSPIALPDSLRAAVDELGPVRHLIAPNWIHYAHLPAWLRAYPDARSWGAPGVVERAEKFKVDLRIDEPLHDGAPEAWGEEIDALMVRGNPVHREVVFFHRASRTLVLTDLIENFEPHHCPAWTRPLLALAGTTDPDGKAPLDMRLSFRFGHGGKGRTMLRAALEQMLAWAPERVILAHGKWYERDGAAELRRAFRWVF